MTGHSRWANLQRRMRAQARRRERATTKSGVTLRQPVRYEGYGPGGAALMVDGLTADRTRLQSSVRRAFSEHGGHLGAQDSVAYLFNSVGFLAYPPARDQKPLVQAALAAGAEDVIVNADDSVEVLTDPLEFASVRGELTRRGFDPAIAEVTQRAASARVLSGAAADAMLALLTALEALEDVQEVHSNVEIAGEVLLRT